MFKAEPLDQPAFPRRIAGAGLSGGGDAFGPRSRALPPLAEEPIQRRLPGHPLRRQPAPKRVRDEPARALRPHAQPFAHAIVQVARNGVGVGVPDRDGQFELMEHSSRQLAKTTAGARGLPAPGGGADWAFSTTLSLQQAVQLREYDLARAQPHRRIGIYSVRV